MARAFPPLSRLGVGLCLAVAALFLSLSPAPATAARPGERDRTVAYTLAPETTYDGRITALRVEMRLTADASGRTRIAWPERWAGTPDLYRWARDFEVDGARQVGSGVDGGRTFTGPPGGALTIRYRVVSAYGHDPTVGDSRPAFPVIRPTWFSAVGEALFAAPLGRENDPATFTWAGPPGIGFASDLEHGSGRHGGPDTTTTVADIQQSVVVGGRSLRVVGDDPAAASHGVRVVTLGAYAFDLRAFTRLAQGIVEAERAFWGDPAPAPFLIAMTPLAPLPGRQEMAGHGRDDGFALWVGQDQPLSGLPWLLAHEYFHRWNAARLGGLATGSGQIRDYWFSEGLTDFYARRLLLRFGLIGPREFIAGWNETLAAYAQSPARSASLADVVAGFWQDDELQKQPYYRGALLAAGWDARLRRTDPGVNLDAVLRRQRRQVAAAPGRYASAVEAFRASARPLGLDPEPEVARHVGDGAFIQLPADAFGPCVTVVTESRPSFARGWDAAATLRAGNLVTGLETGSPAWRAGLRNGMRIIERVAGTPGDAGSEYVMRVDVGHREGVIRFYPAGPLVLAQRLVPDEARLARQPAACTASLSGG